MMGIDLGDTTVLATNRLKTTGEEYALVSLSAKHVDQILALHTAGYTELPPEERHFMLPKDRTFFEKHFVAGNHVFGVVHNGKLVAECIVVNPTKAHPKTGMTDMNVRVSAEKVTILQGVIVDPDYRGNSLMGVMVDAWLAQAQKHGRVHVLAEAAHGNAFSWSVFLQKGLHIESCGTDPSDGTGVYHLHGHVPQLSKVFNQSAKKVAVCPQADIAKQKKLLAKGYKGTAYDRATGNLQFHRPAKKLRCV